MLSTTVAPRNVYHTKRFQLCSPVCGGFKERYRNSHVTLKVDPNKQRELANNVVTSASARAVSLLVLSLALVATFREKLTDVTMRGQKSDFYTSNCKLYETVRDH